MKKYLKFISCIIFLILMSSIIYIIYRKISLNNYLNLTIENSKKINYSTNINLNIRNEFYDKKFIYDVDRSSYIQKIFVQTYDKDVLTGNILKYNILKGSKKGTYILNNDKYEKIDDNSKIDIDYIKLKNSIINIKSMKNINQYKKYVVKIKGYDAYNLIYDKNILTKNDYNKNILLTILIDKKNNFIHEIKYDITDIINNDDDKINYSVNIKNININNKNKINLPF